MDWVGDQKMSHSWCNLPQNPPDSRAGRPVLLAAVISGTPTL
jgi:hypothetical protein